VETTKLASKSESQRIEHT